MKKLFTSSLLTAVAVPFLMAAPHAAKKSQDQASAPATKTETAAPKTKAKKQSKKVKATAAKTDSAPVAKTENAPAAPKH
jgi:hypothetical protein